MNEGRKKLKKDIYLRLNSLRRTWTKVHSNSETSLFHIERLLLAGLRIKVKGDVLTKKKRKVMRNGGGPNWEKL